MTAARSAEWDLIEAAQAGNRDAFGRLYARYANEVSRFVTSRTGDRVLADDLTSETFLRALRRIDSVSYQGRDPGAWFTTIARNLVLDHVKSSRYQRDRPTADITDADDRNDSPEQAVIRRDTAAEVRRRVAELPADQQECIRLRYLDELSIAETAAVMGRSDSAVKALTHRGVEGLRASMTKATQASQPVPPTREAIPDPMVRVRRAVTEIRQHRDRQATQQRRTEQLARWHSNDQAVADEQHEDDHDALAMTTGGGAR